jgi:hypothetical protein
VFEQLAEHPEQLVFRDFVGGGGLVNTRAQTAALDRPCGELSPGERRDPVPEVVGPTVDWALLAQEPSE